MKKMFYRLLVAAWLPLLAMSACTTEDPWPSEEPTPVPTPPTPIIETMKIDLTINGWTLTATLADNSSAKALVELLRQGAVTLELSDYSHFEKVGQLPVTLPRNDAEITTSVGDLILYLGRSFVIYYDTNHWSLTRLGRIDSISQSELKALLGTGDVVVTLALHTEE